MASKSGGWKPPSGKFNPPFGSGKTSKIGGTHCAGPMSNHGGGGEGVVQAHAVERNQRGMGAPPKK
ncbi:MAG TPA: hypothetical protein VFB50_12265 [Chloroflexota bacterium]|nr:hypothetical protein [Chloroflexota bacterium]